MKKIILSTIVASTILFANDNKYEITPIVTHIDTKEHKGFKNHNAAGVTIGIRDGEDCKFDQTEIGLLLSSQNIGANEESDINRVFINKIKEYDIVTKTKLYALIGLGYEDTVSLDDNGIFFNYGAGVKYSFNDTVGLKLDARHLIRFDGMKHMLYTAGLSFSFGEVAKKEIEKKPVVVVPPKKVEKPKVEVKPIVIKEIPKDIDSDKDGVLDSKDKCPNTIVNTKVDENGCEIKKKLIVPTNLNIIFEMYSTKIKDSDMGQINKYVEYLKANKDAKVILEAYTDSKGTEAYNIQLSKSRAESTKLKFISMGIEVHRIETVGHGEANPIASNDTPENRDLNRRATARIVK